MGCISLKDFKVVRYEKCDQMVREKYNGSVVKAVVTEQKYNEYKNEFLYLFRNESTASLVMAIMNLAYANGLNPWILAVQAFKESRYRWQNMVLSGSDAKGLFQFLGDSWMDPVKAIARAYGIRLQMNMDDCIKLYRAFDNKKNRPPLDIKYKVLEEFEMLSGFYRVVAQWNAAGGVYYQRSLFQNFRHLNDGLYFRAIMSHYCGVTVNCDENEHVPKAVEYAVDALGNAVRAFIDVWVSKFGEDPHKWPKPKWPDISAYTLERQNRQFYELGVFRMYNPSSLPSFQQMAGYVPIWSKLGMSSPHIYTLQESYNLAVQNVPALSYEEAIEKRKTSDIVYNVSVHPAPYYDSGVTIRDFNPVAMIPSEYA